MSAVVRRVVVVGGRSGIGRAIAARFAADGADVVAMIYIGCTRGFFMTAKNAKGAKVAKEKQGLIPSLRPWRPWRSHSMGNPPRAASAPV